MVTDVLSTTFFALADPTRRAILARLANGEASVTELAEPFDMTLPAVSKHLKVLERAGLIERAREAQWRPCRLQAAPLRDVDEWVERYRKHWEESFERLDEYLMQLQANDPKSSPPQVLDEAAATGSSGTTFEPDPATTAANEPTSEPAKPE
jgi:DNA-binding transcriptional ArsR family regulator